MSGLFFNADAPADYRAWVHSDYTFYDTLAPNLHDVGVLVEPDSREPWFLSEAHDIIIDRVILILYRLFTIHSPVQ